MANKHQVLELLATGMANSEIAATLKCLPAYVRAVRAREFGNGREVDTSYQRRRYATDPEYRAAKLEAAKEWSQNNREKRRQYWRNWYIRQKQEGARHKCSL